MTTVAEASGIAKSPELPTAGQSLVLDRVSWATYEALLADFEDRPNPHFFFNQGKLEIMVASPRHEKANRILALFVEIIAEELGLNVESFGSATFRRADLEKGFEPDSCFYVANAPGMVGKAEVDLTVDPPPDLILEIDLTSSSLGRFPIYAATGIPEIWRTDCSTVEFLKLSGEKYLPIESSAAFPLIRSEDATRFFLEGMAEEKLKWVRKLRAWVRSEFIGPVS